MKPVGCRLGWIFYLLSELVPEPAVSGRMATQLSFDSRPVDSVEMPVGYVPPRQTLETALRTAGIIALREHLDGSWTLYLSRWH